MARQLKPRTPSGYDSAIHGRKDYDSPLSDDEPENDVVARTRLWDAIATSSESARRNVILALRPAWVPATDASIVTTIWYHGGKSYSVDGPKKNQVVITDEEHLVLQLFSEKKFAMNRADIEKTANITNAPRVLKQLTDRYERRFANAIVRPGRKGKGGYFVRVERFAQPAE